MWKGKRAMQLKATPKQDNKSVGERSEAFILAKLVELGFHVFCPWGENHRVDLLIEDEEERFYRVQCKTGRIYKACVRFNTVSSYAHHRRGGKRDYRGQADYFAVYVPKIQKFYLIPVESVGTKEGFYVLNQPGIARRNTCAGRKIMNCRVKREEPVDGLEPTT